MVMMVCAETLEKSVCVLCVCVWGGHQKKGKCDLLVRIFCKVVHHFAK